jgi:hypothetical protein
MPTESKPLTGLFKWKDIKRWHTTWHVYLCKHLVDIRFPQMLIGEKFPYSLRSWPSLVSLEDPVSCLYHHDTEGTNRRSDFLGQELQRYWTTSCLLGRCD